MGKPPGRYGTPLTRKQAAIMDQLCDGKKRAKIVEFTGMAKQTVDMHLAQARRRNHDPGRRALRTA